MVNIRLYLLCMLCMLCLLFYGYHGRPESILLE